MTQSQGRFLSWHPELKGDHHFCSETSWLRQECSEGLSLSVWFLLSSVVRYFTMVCFTFRSSKTWHEELHLVQGWRSFPPHTLQQLSIDCSRGCNWVKPSVFCWHWMSCSSTLIYSRWLPDSLVLRCSFSFPYRYLYVYKHTVDLLIEHGVFCTKEAPLPVISMAISHLWQELSEERRDSVLQYCSQRDFLLDPKAACQEPVCTDGDMRDSQGNSDEASGSSVSTPEEVSAQ